jgi:hypothetical protein
VTEPVETIGALQHRCESVETELRETAGELEKARARITELERGTLPAPFMVRMVRDQQWELVPPGSKSRLAEATALLVECVGHMPLELDNRVVEWIESSRAPAQPAMCRADTGGVPCGEPEPCTEHPADPLRSFDARVWAREFMRLLDDGTFQMNAEPGEETINEGLMLSWFANALMRGFDEHRWQTEKQPAAPEPSADERLTACLDELSAEQARRLAAEAQIAVAQEDCNRFDEAAATNERLWMQAQQRACVAESQLAAANERIRELEAMTEKRRAPESIQSQVRADLVERERLGIERYGTALYPNNGRDALQDAYEEALDMCQYLKQALVEKSATTAPLTPAPSPGADHCWRDWCTSDQPCVHCESPAADPGEGTET